MRTLLFISNGKDSIKIQSRVKSRVQTDLDAAVTVKTQGDKWSNQDRITEQEFLQVVQDVDKVAFLCTQSMKDAVEGETDFSLYHGKWVMTLDFSGIRRLLEDDQLCLKCILLYQDNNHIHKKMKVIEDQIPIDDNFTRKLREVVCQ